MPKKNNAPTQAELQAIAARLRPGQRETVATGIYMTRDSSGRLRFQWRARVAGGGSRNAGGTKDSYELAVAARDKRLQRKHDSKQNRRERGLRMPLEQLMADHWLEHVLTLEDNTQLDYLSAWDKDIYPYFKGVKLEALLDFEPEEWDEWDKWLKKRHTKPDGTLARSAVEKAYNVLGRLLGFGVEEELLPFNPLESVQSRRRRRDREARKRAARQSEERVVLRSEVPTPTQIERIRLWLPGRDPLERMTRRTLVSVLGWAGLRPGEALYLRWHHLRDPFGPLGYIMVRGAVKDIAGNLQEGDTKTHTVRDALSFPFLDAELDALYQALGAPRLGARVFPNREGQPARWDNFRQRTWYTALHRAGIAEQPEAKATGAFYPYRLRHHAASLLLHAERPGGGRYSHAKVADSLGHTEQVLVQTYSRIVDDDVLDAGGHTVEEIALAARRRVFGPLPGDPDYRDVELTTTETAALTGISVSAVCARCARGSLPARSENGRYLISEYDLMMAGLLDPSDRRG